VHAQVQACGAEFHRPFAALPVQGRNGPADSAAKWINTKTLYPGFRQVIPPGREPIFGRMAYETGSISNPLKIITRANGLFFQKIAQALVPPCPKARPRMPKYTPAVGMNHFILLNVK